MYFSRIAKSMPWIFFALTFGHRINTAVVLDNFKDADGQFFCSTGQFNKDVASMLSLYRASQLAFPEENILDEAKSFSTQYLREALEKSETFISWNHRQSLSEEVTAYL
jgi:ent-copalyl diphosphate synthase